MAIVNRPYQVTAILNAEKGFETLQSVMEVLPTGCGKSRIFSELVRRMQPKRSLVLAHRSELVWQAARNVNATGLETSVEKADSYADVNLFNRSPVVVASVQTMVSGRGEKKRMHRWNPKDFGFIVCDECFPAGTLVDGIPIEKIKCGDRIKTHQGYGTVTHTFKKQTNEICVITYESGETLVCTPNHPVWCQAGFMPAENLRSGDMMATITDYESMQSVSGRNKRRRKTVRPAGMPVGIFTQDDRGDIQEERRRDHAISKDERDESARSEGQGFAEAPGNGMDANHSRREWPGPNYSRNGIVGGSRVALQCVGEDLHETWQWLSRLLQTGHRQFRFDDWGGSGWVFSQLYGEAVSGSKKGGVLNFERVARVKVYKQGSGDEFEWLCPEGAVYNLEVSNGNTYFAAGVLVHNCHHFTAPMFKRVLDYFREGNPGIKIFGCTASPKRADDQALGLVFQECVFKYQIADAISDGWLVPVKAIGLEVEDMDLSGIKTSDGDLNTAELAAIMEREKPLYGVAAAALEAAFYMEPNALHGVPRERWYDFLMDHNTPPRLHAVLCG